MAETSHSEQAREVVTSLLVDPTVMVEEVILHHVDLVGVVLHTDPVPPLTMVEEEMMMTPKTMGTLLAVADVAESLFGNARKILISEKWHFILRWM